MLASLACLLFSTVGNCAATIKDSIARECGVDADQPAQRIFADPEGKNAWREFKKLKDVTEIQTYGRFAQLWTASDGKVFVHMEEPSEDWFTYTDYCFGKTGRLVALRFEVRTAWGWDYRESGSVVKGILRPRTSGFFDADREKPIAKPENAADVAAALTPFVFAQESQLPVAKLLSK
ncbi:MAG: hypothetical protein ABLT11_11345 [Candidatus Acidiferrum sp.]